MKPDFERYSWRIEAFLIAIGAIWSVVASGAHYFDRSDRSVDSRVAVIDVGPITFRTYPGGVIVGAGRPGLWGRAFSANGAGGIDSFGFVATFEWRSSHEDRPVMSTWILLGLPWWIMIAACIRRPLHRFAIRRATAAHAWRLLIEEEKRQSRARSFSSNPRCETCGYDMRATVDKCPECGWIPDFQTTPEAGAGRIG